MQKGESAISAALAAVILLIFIAVQQRWQLVRLEDFAASAEEYVLTTTGLRGQIPELSGFERVKTYRLGDYRAALYRASPAPLVFAPGRFVIYDRGNRPVFKLDTLEGSRDPWTAVYDFAGHNGITPPGNRRTNYTLDLTGTGTLDTLVAQYSGGDHCCTIATVLELGKDAVRVVGRIGGLDGLPFEGMELRKIGKDPAWEIIAHQPFRTLCGGHEDAADVPAIYGYVKGQYADQTAQHLDYLRTLIQRDEQRWAREKERSISLLLTIAARDALLGEREEGKRYFAMNFPSILPALRERGVDPNVCLDDALGFLDRLPSLAR